MSCNITSGWAIDCLDSQGGIEKVFITNGPVTSFTASNGIVSAINIGANPASFFAFDVPKQTSTLTETVDVSVENGTVMYTQELVLVFNKMEAAKRNQILLMAQNPNLLVIAKDNNGKYWSIGLERGANITTAEITSGTAYEDRNGGEITLTGMEASPMFEVQEAVITPAPTPTP